MNLDIGDLVYKENLIEWGYVPIWSSLIGKDLKREIHVYHHKETSTDIMIETAERYSKDLYSVVLKLPIKKVNDILRHTKVCGFQR